MSQIATFKAKPFVLEVEFLGCFTSPIPLTRAYVTILQVLDKYLAFLDFLKVHPEPEGVERVETKEASEFAITI